MFGFLERNPGVGLTSGAEGDGTGGAEDGGTSGAKDDGTGDTEAQKHSQEGYEEGRTPQSCTAAHRARVQQHINNARQRHEHILLTLVSLDSLTVITHVHVRGVIDDLHPPQDGNLFVGPKGFHSF